ncbi:MAG: ABC transporter permease [Chloroflexi bacterium]|nr:ABC transporter permease [Chloroflexota bacterium]
MKAYMARRIVQMAPALLLATLVMFSMVFLLPGDPTVNLMGEEAATATPEQIEAFRQRYGLDQPFFIQYTTWLKNALQGDLGRSFRNREPVTESIATRLPVTLELALLSTVMAIVIGVPAGIVSAIKRNSIMDMFVTAFSVMWVALPNFWLAILLIMVFAVMLEWLPVAGYVPLALDPVGNLKSLLLPAFALGSHYAAVLARQTRSGMLEVLHQDYIRTARAKGLHERRVVLLHALKNALIPIVTLLGLHLGRVLGGTVIIETVFAIPGMGLLVIASIHGRDYMAAQGAILVLVLGIMISNLLADVTYVYVDPRIKYS